MGDALRSSFRGQGGQRVPLTFCGHLHASGTRRHPSTAVLGFFASRSVFSTHPLLPLPSTSSPLPLQIFEGNSNYDTPELRIVEPLLTRFVRIYPERATPTGLGLRLELIGCEIASKAERRTSFHFFRGRCSA